MAILEPVSPEVIASMQSIATVFFGLAIVHTFAVKRFQTLAHRFEEGSVGENIFHFLGEVEVVFGLWAAALIAFWIAFHGSDSAVSYLSSVNFTEPAFVFVIMCMAATRPVLHFARVLISGIAKVVPVVPPGVSLYATILILGPILGSFITEPAAMTVTALLLKETFFTSEKSSKFLYTTIGLLFVNVSIGGTLTHFAAPPVLMVASVWQWDTPFMMTHFGWKSVIAVVIGTVVTAFLFRKELMNKPKMQKEESSLKTLPWWLIASHLFFIFVTVYFSHHMSFFLPLFLFFLGWCTVTKEYQSELKVRESLLVAFFLGGLVTLGKLQAWWLQPLLSSLSEREIFWSAAGLTAFTDNAAITYLGTLVPTLSDSARYLLVAGAVTGGGLTVIANAPNPAGFSILNEAFGRDGISPIRLFVGALPFTLLAAAAMLLL